MAAKTLETEVESRLPEAGDRRTIQIGQLLSVLILLDGKSMFWYSTTA